MDEEELLRQAQLLSMGEEPNKPEIPKDTEVKIEEALDEGFLEELMEDFDVKLDDKDKEEALNKKKEGEEKKD